MTPAPAAPPRDRGPPPVLHLAQEATEVAGGISLLEEITDEGLQEEEGTKGVTRGPSCTPTSPVDLPTSTSCPTSISCPTPTSCIKPPPQLLPNF